MLSKGQDMKALHEYMSDFRKQLEKGDIQKAYKGLIEYIMGLRLHFSSKYPNYSVSGNLYCGYMDMTYFSFTSPSLKARKLKVAIVFVYEKFRFEVWLAGVNKQTQKQYWELLKESHWNKYRIPSTIAGIDSMLEHVLVENPDFSDLDALTGQIESGTLKFIEDIESFFLSNVKGT